jgi:hypothetical protein
MAIKYFSSINIDGGLTTADDVTINSGNLIIDTSDNSSGKIYLGKASGTQGNSLIDSSHNLEIDYGTYSGTGILYIRSNSATVASFQANGDASFLFDVQLAATKKLFLDGSDNTYIYESSDGVIDFYGDNTHLVSMKQNGTQSEVVVNEGSGDVDFRVEANNDTHAFFVEAEGTGRVQIGTQPDSATTADSKVHVVSNTAPSTVNGFSHLKLDYTAGSNPDTPGAQIMFNQGYHSGNVDYTQPVGSIRGWKTGADTNYGGGLQLLYQPDAGALGLLVGMTLTGGGKVGVGNDNPDDFDDYADNLVVGTGSGHEGMTIYSGSSSYGSIYFADASSGTARYKGWVTYLHNTEKMHFGVNESNRMVIDISGNLGVGTTDPLTKLDVSTSGNTAIPALDAVPGASTSAIFRNSGNTVILATGVDNANTSWLQGRQTTGTGSAFDIALNPLGGQVGIGTSVPANTLDVGGGVVVDPTIRIDSASGGNPTLIFDASQADRSAHIRFYDNGSAVGGFIDYHHDGDKMNFGSGSSTGVTMTVGDQKVGIGTTSPDEKLHIVDSSGANVILNSDANTANSGIYMSEGADATPTQNGAYLYYDATNNDFKISTGGSSLTDRLKIDRDSGDATFLDRVFVEDDVNITAGALSITADGSNKATFVESGAGLLTITTDDDFVVDAAGDITLDAAGDDIRFKDSGNTFGYVSSNSTDDFVIGAGTPDKDIIFKGTDNTTPITALTLDMSEAGNATFAGNITTGDDGSVIGGDGVVSLYARSTGSVSYIQIQNSSTGTNTTNDGLTIGNNGTTAYVWQREAANLNLGTNDTAALSIDSSQNSIFAGDVTIDEKIVALGGLAAYTAASSINAYSRTVSTDLYSALRVIENSTASNYWDIGATGGASTILNFYHNGTTTPKMTLDNSGDASFTGSITSTGTDPNTFSGDLDVGGTKYLYLGGWVRINNSGTGTFNLDQYNGSSWIDTLSITNAGAATFIDQAFSAATSSGDSSTTLTTKGYVDGLITGATIYRGTWDPSGGGYGSPALNGVTQTNGYYYVCSADGTAEPNGTGTEPDTWHTGDWVIFNDHTGSGEWQKIDNSSVLSGAGTANTVSKWSDTETLADGPITFSGDNSTFAGTITTASGQSISNAGKIIMQSDGTLDWGGAADYGNLTWDTGKAIIAGMSGKALEFRTNQSSVALTLDTSQDATFTGNVDLTTDNKAIRLGSGGNLSIKYDGSNGKIENNTGHFYIINESDDKSIYFQTDDGSGGTTTYMKVDGLSEYTQFDKPARFMDNVFCQFGNSNDSDIYHNGTDMFMRNYVDDGDIRFYCDDGSGGITEYFSLDGGTVLTRFYKGAHFQDNVKLTFGDVTTPDLEIFHDSGNSYISDIGTGNLFIQASNNIYFRNQAQTEYMAIFTENGGVSLYFDNVMKMETISEGINVSSGTPVVKLTDTSSSATVTHTLDGVSYELINNGTDGTIKIDAKADITIDAGGGDLIIADDGTIVGTLSLNSSDFEIRSRVSDKDLIFKGNDGGSEIIALTLDMSNGGSAVFRDDIDYGGKLTQTGTGTNFFKGSGYAQIKIASNLTDDTNKLSGIFTENYEGNNVSIFQTFTQNNNNTIYYGSADGAYAGMQNHRFYVNADSDTAGSGHTEALHIASNTNATFGGNVGIAGSADSVYSLAVNTTDEDAVQIYNSTDGLDALITFQNPGGTLGRIQGLDNGGLGFDTGNNAGGVNSNVLHLSNAKLATFSGTVLIDGVANYTGLEVKGSGASRPSVNFTNVTQGNLGRIYGTEGQAIIIGTGGSNTTALTLDSSQDAEFASDVTVIGNLGVGSLNPSYNFYNNGTAYLNGATTVDSSLTITGNTLGTTADFFSAGDGNSPVFHVKDTADTFVALFEGNRAGDTGANLHLRHWPATAAESNRTKLFFEMKDDGGNVTKYGTIAAFIDDYTDTTEDGNLRFNIMKGGVDTEMLRINNTGVGIGTDNPTAKLKVVGENDAWTCQIENTQALPYGLSVNTAGTAGTSFNSAFYTHSGTGMFILNDGKVGIGNSSPSSELTVGTSDHTEITIGDASGNAQGRLRFLTSNNQKNFQIGFNYNVAGGLEFTRSSAVGGTAFTTPDMTIQGSSGNVGVGTNTPGSKLSIEDGNLEFLSTSAATIKNRIKFSEAVWGDESFYIEHDGAGAGINNYLKIYGDGSGGTETGISVARGGNVGIGTENPDFNANASNLVVGSGSGNQGITIYSGSSAGNYGSIYFADGRADGAEEYRGMITYEQNNEVMRFHTNTVEALELGLNQNATFAGQIVTSVSTGIGRDNHNYITFSTDDNIIYRVGNGHRFKMISDAFAPYADSSYDLGTSSLYFRHAYIDAITTTGDVTLGGDLYVPDRIYPTSTTTQYIDMTDTGTSIRVAGDIAAFYTSDIRFKDNVMPIENALEKVCKLSGYTFVWNEDSHHETGKKDIGVIAQEVEESFPELVDTRETGYKAVDYQKLTAVLIQAVKELKEELSEVKKQLNH